MKLLSMGAGWRTYAACVIAIALGVAEYFGYHVSESILTVLCGLVGITLRAGLKNDAKAAVEAVIKLGEDVTQTITVNNASPAVAPSSVQATLVDSTKTI